jgi:glycerol-3-phosphate dehydrogenase
MWDWGAGRSHDDVLRNIHENRNVHGDGGAYVGGNWVDIEDCAAHFNVTDGSDGKVGCGACPRSRSRHTAAKADGTYDVIVIGAGCIGSAVARELSKTTASVLILEAADDVTQGATKGNSGIIHAGFDDKPGTNRAKYCWAGNQMFKQLDTELHFGFQSTGSLVVARTEEDLQTLDELLARGRKNGVQNLKIVNQKELRQLEPHIDEGAIAALFSPDAGTITPYEYTIALAESAVDNGVEIRTRREIVAIARDESTSLFTIDAMHWEPEGVDQDAYPVTAAQVPPASAAGPATATEWTFSPSPGTVMGGAAKRESYRAKFIVNAAGCASDKIAAMVRGATSLYGPSL